MMTHSRAGAAGELANGAGCISTTFIAESSAFADADYDTWYDGQGFALPGKLLTGISEQGASVVVDIDP